MNCASQAPADTPFILWTTDRPFPEHDEMQDLDVATHVVVARARQGEYHFLHECAITWHGGALNLCWANHLLFEANSKDELIRGTRSLDGGMSWEEPGAWVAPPTGGAESYNHPVLVSHQGRLWGFFARWDQERPSTEVFVRHDASGRWESTGTRIPGFISFRPPVRTRAGHWIIGGEMHWHEAAVALSRGDDWGTWDVAVLPRPDGMELLYPEVTLMDRGERLLGICRPRETTFAPVSESADSGKTWTPLRFSNFPLAASKPLCGKLSTGQHYLITNNHQQGRTLLSIAVTRPGGTVFERVWKIRHQQWPKIRLVSRLDGRSRAGEPTSWCYPAAVEHDRRLFVACTHGGEDSVMSVIPLRVLAV